MVIVLRPFDSDSTSRVPLLVDVKGKVIDIDADGDAEIEFDGIHRNQWVFKEHFPNIGILQATALALLTFVSHSLRKVLPPCRFVRALHVPPHSFNIFFDCSNIFERLVFSNVLTSTFALIRCSLPALIRKR